MRNGGIVKMHLLLWSLIAALMLTGAAGASYTPGAVGADVVNAGGVLLLHVEGSYELGSYKLCDSLALESPDQAVTRLPGDGSPYLVGCYAAFPPGSPGYVRAVSFGIRYPSNVRVISLGPCNGGRMIFPGMDWPASGGGVGVTFPDQPAKVGELSTVYWFAVQSEGEGFIELTPHPVYRLAGSFADDDTPPRTEPITGYGRIGFDQAGFLPEPGERHYRGACCTPDGCHIVTALECEHYESIFLGPGTDCESRPCSDHALRGGCCLEGGCEDHTWVNCVLLGGHFLGEGVMCGSMPCPDPETSTPEEP